MKYTMTASEIHTTLLNEGNEFIKNRRKNYYLLIQGKITEDEWLENYNALQKKINNWKKRVEKFAIENARKMYFDEPSTLDQVTRNIKSKIRRSEEIDIVKYLK